MKTFNYVGLAAIKYCQLMRKILFNVLFLFGIQFPFQEDWNLYLYLSQYYVTLYYVNGVLFSHWEPSEWSIIRLAT